MEIRVYHKHIFTFKTIKNTPKTRYNNVLKRPNDVDFSQASHRMNMGSKHGNFKKRRLGYGDVFLDSLNYNDIQVTIFSLRIIIYKVHE
jgi:hypothetical protein